MTTKIEMRKENNNDDDDNDRTSIEEPKKNANKKKWSKHLKGYSFLHFTLCCFFRARLIKRGVKPVSLTLFAELNLHIHITYIRREIEREKWKENYFCMMAKPTARIEQKKNQNTKWIHQRHDTTRHDIAFHNQRQYFFFIRRMNVKKTREKESDWKT